MANEFIDFVSGTSILDPDTFVKRMVSIIDKVRNAAMQAKNDVEKNPADASYEQKLTLAEEYLALMELLDAGNRMTEDIVAGMYALAMQNPNNETNAEIIGLTKLHHAKDDKDSN